MARYKAANMLEVGKIIEEKILPKKHRGFLKYSWQQLVQKTPVDTYTASNSWFVTADAPSTVKPDYKEYGARPGVPGVLRSGSAFKAAFSGSGYDLFYITNNQDYIGVLERGRSTQQPQPWIKPTIKIAVNLYNAGKF